MENLNIAVTTNPLCQCKTDDDVRKVVDVFIQDFPDEPRESFWHQAVRTLLCACTSLLVNYGDKDVLLMDGHTYEVCPSGLAKLIRLANSKPDANDSWANPKSEKFDAEYQNTKSPSKLDHIFHNIARKVDMEHSEEPFCLNQWREFNKQYISPSDAIIQTASVMLESSLC